jgi:hypothetical protein
VIAGNVNHPCALAHLAQQLLHDIIVGLRPIPPVLEPPSVDHVADEIDRPGIVMFQKIEQKLGLTAARAKVNVRQEKRPVNGRLWFQFFAHRHKLGSLKCCEDKPDSYGGWMTKAPLGGVAIAAMPRRTSGSRYNCSIFAQRSASLLAPGTYTASVKHGCRRA